MLVGREPEPPYERPPLSKEYLRGEAEARGRLRPRADWYEENDVELLTGTNVMALDSEARTAKLQGGEEVEFGKALIATGAKVQHPAASTGAAAGGDPLPARVRQLRRDPRGRREAEQRRADRRQLHRLRGGGVADREGEELHDRDDGGRGRCRGRSARRRGAGSTSCSSRTGVEIIGGETLDGVRGRRSGSRRCVTESGETVEGDMVVVGAGVQPDMMLAAARRARGRRRDRLRRALQSSVEGIYAAGDCCSYDSVVHGRRLRVEHWDVALQQGQYARRAMLGEQQPYDVVPVLLQRPRRLGEPRVRRARRATGTRTSGAATATRGEFSRLVPRRTAGSAGALSVGRSEDLIDARRLLAEGVDVSAHRAEISDAESDLARSLGR